MFSWKGEREIALEFSFNSKSQEPLWKGSCELAGYQFTISVGKGKDEFSLRLSLGSGEIPVTVIAEVPAVPMLRKIAEIPAVPMLRKIVRFKMSKFQGRSPYQIRMPWPKDKDDMTVRVRIRIEKKEKENPSPASSLYFQVGAQDVKKTAGIDRGEMYTCYMIAGLRLLYITIGFRRFVIRACEESTYDERPVLFALRDLFARLDGQETVRLWPLLDAMMFPVFNVTEKQDVAEFLQKLMDCVKLEIGDNEELTREIDEMFLCETVDEEATKPWSLGQLNASECSWCDFPGFQANPQCRVARAPEVLALSIPIRIQNSRIPMVFDVSKLTGQEVEDKETLYELFGVVFFSPLNEHYTVRVRSGSHDQWTHWNDHTGTVGDEASLRKFVGHEPRLLWYVRHDRVEALMTGEVKNIEIEQYRRVLTEKMACKAIEVGAYIRMWSPCIEYYRSEAEWEMACGSKETIWCVGPKKSSIGDSFLFVPERADQDQKERSVARSVQLVQYAHWDQETFLTKPFVCLADALPEPKEGCTHFTRKHDQLRGPIWVEVKDRRLCPWDYTSFIIECQPEKKEVPVEKKPETKLVEGVPKYLDEHRHERLHFFGLGRKNVSCRPLGEASESDQPKTLSCEDIIRDALNRMASGDRGPNALLCGYKGRFFRVFSCPGLPDYVSTCKWSGRCDAWIADPMANFLPPSKEWAFRCTESTKSIRVVIEETGAIHDIDDSDSLEIAKIREKFQIPDSLSPLRIRSDGRTQKIHSILNDSDIVSKSTDREEILFAAIPCKDLTKMQGVIYAVPVPGNRNGVMQFGRPFLVSREENADAIYQSLWSKRRPIEESELWFCLGSRKYKRITPALIREFFECPSPKLAKATWAIVIPMEWPQVACDIYSYFKDRFTYADFC